MTDRLSAVKVKLETNMTEHCRSVVDKRIKTLRCLCNVACVKEIEEDGLKYVLIVFGKEIRTDDAEEILSAISTIMHKSTIGVVADYNLYIDCSLVYSNMTISFFDLIDTKLSESKNPSEIMALVNLRKYIGTAMRDFREQNGK